MGHLTQFVACADDYGQENSNANGYSSPRGGGGYSPLLKPLSPPLTDAEIVQLERQVQQASLRVAKLREDMQIKLKDELSSKLAECRPTAHDPESPMLVIDGTSEDDLANGAINNNNNNREEALAAATAAAQAGLPPGFTPQELQDKLAMAATKLPSLRARLEEANSRLQRVASEVSDDLRRNTTLPPNTVERTLLGKTTPKAVLVMSMVNNGDNGNNREGGDHEGEGVPQPDPAVLRALESGQIATGRGNSRRRTTGGGKIQLASTAVTPVPYNIPVDGEEEEEKVPGGQ